MAEIIFPDVANAFAKVQSIQSNALRERLLMTQASREEEAYQRDKQARGIYPAAIGGDAAATRQLAGLSPELHGALMKAKKEGREQQLAEFNQRNQVIGQAAAAVLAVPPEQRPAVYAAQRQRLLASGIVTDAQVPPQYSEGMVIAAARNAQSVDAVMKQLGEQPQVMTPGGGMRPVSQMGSAPAAPPPAPGGVQPAQNPPAMSPAASQGAAPLPIMPPMPEPEPAPLPAAPPDRAAVNAQAQWAARGVNPQGLSPAEEARAVSEAARAGARSAMAQRPSPPPTASGGPPMPVGTAIAAAGPADMPAIGSQPAQGNDAGRPLPVMVEGKPYTQGAPPGFQWGLTQGGQWVQMQVPGSESSDKDMVEINDPNSPTGRRAVPRFTQRDGYVPAKDATEGQANANLYATRMRDANAILSQPKVTEAGQRFWSRAVTETTFPFTNQRVIPELLTNRNASPEFQQLRNAELNFATAVLRRESGAVISPSEFADAERNYFPRPGDDKTVIAQKANNRRLAIEGIGRAAQPGFGETGPTGTSPPGMAGPASPRPQSSAAPAGIPPPPPGFQLVR